MKKHVDEHRDDIPRCENRWVFLTLCLDSSSVDISRRFYERLGLSFCSERHGDRGLPHFATIISEMSMEIYPTIKALPSADRLFIGFVVDDPTSMRNELIEQFGGAPAEAAATPSAIVALRDPNGLLIRLFPKTL